MSEPIDFERSIKALESIVGKLEQGDLNLEQSLQEFEQGIVLARQCQSILNEAEQKIEYLSRSKEDPETKHD